MRTKGSATELEARVVVLRSISRHGSLSQKPPDLSGESFQRQALETSVAGRRHVGISRQPHPGPTPKLSTEQKQELLDILKAGPIASGFKTDLWTCGGWPKWSAKSFACRTIPTIWAAFCTIWDTVHKSLVELLGTGCRSGRALGKHDWPRIKKKARRRGASIVFIDESGFRLQPVNRRTWAPTGETPIQRAWDRYDRLSVISAVSLSPCRRHIRTPFQIHPDNIRTAEAVAFIRELRKSLRGPLIIVWDRWSAHRAAAKQILASRLKQIDFEWLPAYAPELNPVEARWSHRSTATWPTSSRTTPRNSSGPFASRSKIRLPTIESKRLSSKLLNYESSSAHSPRRGQ